ncbi:MAG: hypothetical protein OXP09_22880 [Gammaproteobacteria bacterium]|nr:hypothetical protein [Gammaproteobacteria bacterium]MDE0368397.1 hypothetical protein [Gammaproteobacteria bacterium]
MSGIFCIETVWERADFVSVKPFLRFVAKYHDAKFKHHIARKPEEFDECLKQWDGRDDWKYPILYLGFHGFTKGLVLAESKSKTLWNNVRFEQLADYSAGTWNNCLVHFGSCSTMDAEPADITAFLERTKLEAISGYAADVDWVPSMAFEFLYFSQLLERIKQRYLRVDTMRNCRDWAAHDRYCASLATALQFRISVNGD